MPSHSSNDLSDRAELDSRPKRGDVGAPSDPSEIAPQEEVASIINDGVIAIFDFDRTIVSKDTGSAFIFEMIRQSRLRLILAALATPVAAPLFLLPSTRLLGISTFLWIGTFGMSEAAFEEACSRFARDFFGSKIRGAAYRACLEAIERHLSRGHRVVVVSGSFAKLVRLMMTNLLGKEVEVIGSTSRVLLGGLVGHEHCVGRRKLEMAIAAGIPDRDWEYGYTDSASDLPIMRRCRKRYIVNPSARTLETFRREFRDAFEVLACSTD